MVWESLCAKTEKTANTKTFNVGLSWPFIRTDNTLPRPNPDLNYWR